MKLRNVLLFSNEKPWEFRYRKILQDWSTGTFPLAYHGMQVYRLFHFHQEITRTDYSEKPFRLSPRRRIHLRDQSRQQSLDIAPMSANRNHPFFKQGSLDSKVEEILESYSNGGYSIKQAVLQTIGLLIESIRSKTHPNTKYNTVIHFFFNVSIS